MRIRHAGLVVLLLARCGTEVTPTVSGTWRGLAEHEGETSPLMLEIHEDSTAALSIPAIDVWDLPIGEARIEDDEISFGPFALVYEASAGVLRGTLPEALAPIHAIPVSFRRGPPLERPRPAARTAPVVDPAWSFSTGAPVWAPVAHRDGVLYAGSDDGRLYALDASTGVPRFELETAGAIRARPVVSAESVFVHSDDGNLYRFDHTTGREAWRVRLGEPATRRSPTDPQSRYESFASAPALDGRRVYVGSAAGRLLAIDAESGRVHWRFETEDAITSSPVVSGGRVFFGSFDGKIYALDADSGRIVWSHDAGAPIPSSPAVDAGLLVIGSRSYDLLGLDVATGEPVWTRYVWFSWIESSARVDGDAVYVGSSDAQQLFALEGRTGRSVWSFDTGGSAWARPAVTEDTVYIGAVGVTDYLVDHRGGFFAVEKESGSLRWRAPSPPIEDADVYGFASSPDVGDALVFVGGLDGRVYAFAR